MLAKNYIHWISELGVKTMPFGDKLINYEILLIKWTFLICLNVIIAFCLATFLYGESIGLLGIMLGILTFIVFYMIIDCQLIRHDNNEIREYFYVAILLKSLTQIIPVIDLLAAMLSVNIIDKMITIKKASPFISTYLITLVDGLLFSIVVILLILAMKFVAYIINLFKHRKSFI